MSVRTARVLDIMKTQLQEKGNVTFEELTAGATKRTAAACFLEILQLKTWNYIDTNQSEPYDDIIITATDQIWNYRTSDISNISVQSYNSNLVQ